ncbi:MAG: hypothetical protein ACLQVD_22125, partial [Capsulimonadaceae bacterium]
MSAVSEDVLTSDETASSATDATPEVLASVASPAPDVNGAAQPEPKVEKAPAPTAHVRSPQAVEDDASGVSQSDFESMFKELAEGDV